MKLIIELSLFLMGNLYASLAAPQPIKPSRTPELVHQQNQLLQQEQQKEYDQLLETLELVALISPQNSPQLRQSPLLSPHITRILNSQH